jgi:hypothetical protein
MAKVRKKNNLSSRPSEIPSIIYLIAGIAMLAVAAVGIFIVLGTNQRGQQRGLGPRLALNTERIDLGKQPLDKTVRAEFAIKNTGDQLLTLDATEPIRALEGC